MNESASPPPAIELRGLVVSYGERRALDGVSLSGTGTSLDVAISASPSAEALL